MSVKSEARLRMLSLMKEGWEEDEELSKEIYRLGEIVWDAQNKYKEPLVPFDIEELSLKRVVQIKERGYTNKDIWTACETKRIVYEESMRKIKDYHCIEDDTKLTEIFEWWNYPEADKTLREILNEEEERMTGAKTNIESYVDDYLKTKKHLKESTVTTYNNVLRRWSPVLYEFYDFSLPIPISSAIEKIKEIGATQSEASAMANFLKWLDSKWDELDDQQDKPQETLPTYEAVTDAIEGAIDEITKGKESDFVYAKEGKYFIFWKDGDYVITDDILYAVNNTEEMPEIEERFNAIKSYVKTKVVYYLETVERSDADER